MVNLGMDFGSTYTMVSIFENGEPRTVQSSHLMFHYPSIVCYDEDKNKYFYGTSARDRLGKKGIIGFRGFKMLLNEQMNPQMLRERNYSDKHTPEFITSFFLRSVLENTLKKLGEDKIGLLVIGAPECWFQSIRTIDARGTLRDICMGFKDIVERVELRSEPTDAAAFCVWNFEKKNKKQFDGSILVVDYGGGTLDTALVSVNHIEDKVQIKPEMLSGIGENSDREIGKAGIAYQEAVVRKAISEALGVPEAQINTNPSFDRAVKDLEDALITDCELIDDTFADYVATPSQLKDEILLSVKYNGWDVDIDFAQMKQAYDETIRSQLQRVLEESSRELGEGEQPYLALVGGFCNFYLVREQIQDHFKLGGVNSKVRTLFHKEEDREKAIAYGACLIANRVIDVCCVANFGIGMYIKFSNRDKVFMRYAINYGQEYIPDKIYFARDKDGTIAPMILTEADTFLLNFNKNPELGFPARPKERFAAALNKAKHDSIAVVGFSIDAAERISVHIFNYSYEAGDDGYGNTIQPAAVIPLSTFKGSFDNMIIPKKG